MLRMCDGMVVDANHPQLVSGRNSR